MNSKLRNLVAVGLLAIAFAGMPMIVSAQDAATETNLDGSAIPNLPNDLQGENAPQTESASNTTTDKPLTQREDFIAGVGVGVAFGILVGGVIVWFTKKS